MNVLASRSLHFPQSAKPNISLQVPDYGQKRALSSRIDVVEPITKSILLKSYLNTSSKRE
jgi:hypothetical protein